MRGYDEFVFIRVTESANEGRGVAVAEINKLSVGKVLDKLRRDKALKTPKTSQISKKLRTTDEEIERLRAASLGLKRGHRGNMTGRD